MIAVIKGSFDRKNIEKTQVLRYLGFGKGTPEPQLSEGIDAVVKEVETALDLRACFTRLDISVTKNAVDFGTFSVSSQSLAKNLSGCKSAILFCATIGAGVDRILLKYSKLSPLKATVAQAAGAAAIEGFCDALCESFQQKSKPLFLRPRFSPGYGDFNIAHQEDLFRLLDAPRKIGVSLTESFLMTPTKSVSAVVGLTAENTQCIQEGCEICAKRACCPYARG